MTPDRWYLVIRPEPAVPVPLSLGCLTWPWVEPEPVEPPWASHEAWHPVPTLDLADHWAPLVTDVAVARRHLAAARRLGPAQALAVSARALPNPLGWDIGPAAGGHSCVRHEADLPAFDPDRAGWPRQHGLFGSRQAALAFWARRSALAPAHPDWETPSGWSLVCLAKLPDCPSAQSVG